MGKILAISGVLRYDVTLFAKDSEIEKREIY
jgi:hypothetical protein